MKKYKYSCELLLRNRFKKFTGQVDAETEGATQCKVFDLFSKQYFIRNPLAFLKSIVVEEVTEI